MPVASEGTSVENALLEARRRLERAPFEITPREAMLLLSHLTGLSEVHLLAHPRERLRPGTVERFVRLVERRATGEPIAYLTGRREFFGRLFEVDRRVLVPRPETEHLVEAALRLPLPRRARLLDVGTGSGSIAVTLAAELPEALVCATDRSIGALAVAKRNARRHGVDERVGLFGTDIATGLDLTVFDAVLTNPPYIEPAERAALSPEVRDFEPPEALFAPPGELAFVRRLLAGLADLAPGTAVGIELGLGQAEPLKRLLPRTVFDLERLVPDYAGIDRVALLRRSTRRS